MSEKATVVIQAEQAVLGSMLIEAAAAQRARLELDGEDFYVDQHRHIFRMMGKMMEQGFTIDVVTVGQRLAMDGKLDEAGGMNGLTDLIHQVATAAHVDHYCKIVKRASLERQFDLQVKRVAQDKTPQNVEKLTDLMYRLESDAVGRILSVQTDIVEIVEQMLKAPMLGYETGFFELDALLVRLCPGDVMTVGARTSGGKTVCMVCMMMNMARNGVKTLYCTSEMDDVQLIQRMLPAISGVPAYRFRAGNLSESEKDAIMRATHEKLQHLPIHVMGRPRLSIGDIRGAAIKTDAQVVFVDYLQRCRMPKAENRVYEIEEFMIQLKTFAQETKKMVVIGAQLDRNSDRNPTVPPTLADLRGSGAIEHESDQVMLLWRPPEEVLKKRFDYIPPREGLIHIEAIIPKNRHGAANVAADFELNGEMVSIAERSMNSREQESKEEEWFKP